MNIHYAVEYPVKAGDRDIAGPVKGWLGGYYETGYSINPHWDADIRSLPKHPITRGVKPFTIRDEWYYGMRWIDDMKGVTPILQAVPPDNTRTTNVHEGPQGRDRDDGLGVRAQGRRPQLRLHRRPLPPQLGRRGLPPRWWSTRSSGAPRWTCPKAGRRSSSTRPT